MRLFDLHCDTLSVCYEKQEELSRNTCHIDLKRASQYDTWVQICAVWQPDTLHGEEAFRRCMDILRFAHREVDKNKDTTCFVRNGNELEKAVAERRQAIFLAVEGGAMLAGDLHNVDVLKAMGVKLITLTWNNANELGYGCGIKAKEGLTEFGKQAVRRMEQQGIVPDVSHLNEAGFWDVMDTVSGPVLASHSMSYTVCPHPRNLTDTQFDELCRRGGLVGLNVCAEHGGEQSFSCMERHLYHYLSRGGERTVALGLDLDGTDVRKDWNGVDTAGLFYEYLCRKNYDETVLSRVFFDNAYEFFKRS